MTTTIAPATLIPIEPPLLPTLDFLYRFTRDQFHEMERLGIIPESNRMELIDGVLVEKPMAGPLHDATIRRINARLGKRMPEGWFLQTNGSLDLDPSEPIPDASVIRGDITDYDHAHPQPTDTGIAIEVSITSLRFDRSEKGAEYSESNIAQFWIINLVDRQIEVYSDPEEFKVPATYAAQAIYKPGDTVPIVLDGQTVSAIPVDELLP